MYCGSAVGARPCYVAVAEELGRELARRDIGLVYGGGAVGLMGAVADSILAAGGQATGVIAQLLVDQEMAHPGLTRLEVVDSMARRKARMEELADAFVVLPGGTGTLEEMIQVLTLQQLGQVRAPVGLLNTAGFWDPYVELCRHQVREGFVQERYLRSLVVASCPAELLDACAGWRAPGAKWEPGPGV